MHYVLEYSSEHYVFFYDKTLPSMCVVVYIFMMRLLQ